MTGLFRKNMGMIFGAGILLGCASLGAAVLPGFISAAETSSPPVIDGKLDDGCWKNTVEVAPFIKAPSMDKKAAEQTKAYICYDKRNLYLAFHCAQGCLDPYQNQLYAFKKDNSANDDDKLFNDDWIVILIQPGIL